MFSHLIAFSLAAMGITTLAHAEALSLDEIKASNGVLLSAEDLQKLIPDAKVVSRAPNGSTRSWTNNSNGSLVASTDSRGRSSTGSTRPHSGEGSWRIENAAYCVTIDWPLSKEQWCRRMYRVGDKYYGVPGRADD